MAALGVALTVLFSYGLSVNSVPTTVFAGLQQAGIGLLIAYSVAIAAVEVGNGSRRVHESWLGFTSGVGMSGLVGVAICIGLAPSWDAHHAGLLPLLFFWWAVSSIATLGFIVAGLPVLAYGWRRSAEPQTAAARWRTPVRGRGR